MFQSIFCCRSTQCQWRCSSSHWRRTWSASNWPTRVPRWLILEDTSCPALQKVIKKINFIDLKSDMKHSYWMFSMFGHSNRREFKPIYDQFRVMHRSLFAVNVFPAVALQTDRFLCLSRTHMPDVWTAWWWCVKRINPGIQLHKNSQAWRRPTRSLAQWRWRPAPRLPYGAVERWSTSPRRGSMSWRLFFLNYFTSKT